jgi:CheY-like chemotaxis protein
MSYKEIIARILVVEDIEDDLKAIKMYLERISQDTLSALGICKLEIDIATSANEAIDYLSVAGKTRCLYDLSLNDLGLPEKNGDKADDEESTIHGLKVIEQSMTNKVVRKAIVVSGFHNPKLVINSFRLGAIDFIIKKVTMVQLQAQVINCLKHVLIERSEDIINERIRHLIRYAQLVLAHYLTVPFSTFVNSTARTTSEVEIYARERYGLDPERDAQDGLMRQLRLQREAISQASRSWSERQDELFASEERPREESVEELLEQIGETLLPCLAVKRTSLQLDFPEFGKSTVLTFQRDVQSVLKEIILGGLAELQDYSNSQKIDVTLDQGDGQVAVRFEDNLQPIKEELAEKINAGNGIVFDPDFGRSWGLSIAQHVAKRGGGELSVEPKTDGNIIIYRIPLCHA